MTWETPSTRAARSRIDGPSIDGGSVAAFGSAIADLAMFWNWVVEIMLMKSAEGISRRSYTIPYLSRATWIMDWMSVTGVAAAALDQAVETVTFRSAGLLQLTV